MASYEMTIQRFVRSAHMLTPDCERTFDWIGGHAMVNQEVADKFFEVAMQRGIHDATKLMQRAANMLLPAHARLTIDGCPGLRMLDAINRSMPAELLAAIDKETQCQS